MVDGSFLAKEASNFKTMNTDIIGSLLKVLGLDKVNKLVGMNQVK